MRKMTAALMILAFVSIVSAQAVPVGVGGELAGEQRIPELTRASEAFKNGDYAECLAQLEAAVQAHPSLPPAKVMLARLFLSSGKMPQAHVLLEQAAAENPNQPDIYLAFGDIALSGGRITDSMLQFEKASAIGPLEGWRDARVKDFKSRCLAGLAAVAEVRGQWEIARQHLTELLELNPTYSGARQMLARALLALDKEDEAFHQIEEAARSAANGESAFVSMARLCMQQGRAEAARRYMEQALKEKEDSAAVHAVKVPGAGSSPWCRPRHFASNAS